MSSQDSGKQDFTLNQGPKKPQVAEDISSKYNYLVSANKKQKRQDATAGLDYYNVKKKEIEFENDSSFSQSQDEDQEHLEFQNKQEQLRQRILKEQLIKSQIKLSHNNQQRAPNGFNNEGFLQRNALAREEINQENMNQDTMSTFNALSLKCQPQPQMPGSATNQTGGFDVLADFLRESQARKFQFNKNKMNFHNTMSFEKQITKNVGGSGNFISNTYNLQNHLRDPSQIIKEKQDEYTVLTPHHMRMQANTAKGTIFTDKDNQLAVTANLSKVRDISYRGDATHSVMEHRQKNRLSLPVVESSVDYLAQNELQKQELQGKDIPSLPSELNVLDERIKNRNKLLAQIDDTKGFLQTLQNSSVKRTTSLSSLQHKQSASTSQPQALNPSSKLDKQILKKHKNMLFYQTQTSHSNFVNLSKKMSPFPREMTSTAGQRQSLFNSQSNQSLPLMSNKRDNVQSQMQRSTGSLSNGNGTQQPATQNNANKLTDNRKILGEMLGNPSSRKDAETLQQWFKVMLQKVNADDQISSEQKLQQKNQVYYATFTELARQVSVQCINRGELLNELWKGFFQDLQVTLKQLRKEKESQVKSLEDQLYDQNLFYHDQLKRKSEELQRQQDLIDKLNLQVNKTTKESENLTVDVERWKLKCEKILSKYTENKFKLLKTETENAKNRQHMGTHQTLMYRKQLQKDMDKEDPVLNDAEFQNLMTQRKPKAASSSRQSISNLNLHIDDIMKRSKQEDSSRASLSSQRNTSNQDEDYQMNLLKKKKKIGAFHNDLNTLTAKKSINLKSYADKAVDTNELNDNFRNEVTTQTIGLANLIAEDATEKARIAFSKRPSPENGQAFKELNFSQEIDKIFESQSLYPHKEAPDADQKNQEGENQPVMHYSQQDPQQDQQVSTKNDQDRTNGNHQKQKTIDKQEHKSNLHGDVVKQGNFISAFSAGLKANILQQVVQKLKDNFKDKEDLIRQVVEENKDLFLQLDIEKAKFQQIIKYQQQDQQSLLEIQHELDKINDKYVQEKSRHKYYKELIQEVSGLKQVKEKIDMSISGIEEEQDNSKSRNVNTSQVNQPQKSTQKKKAGDKTNSKESDQIPLQGSDDWGLEGTTDRDQEEFLIEESSDEDDDHYNSQGLDHFKSNSEKLSSPVLKKRRNFSNHAAHAFISKLIKKINLPRFVKVHCTLKSLLKTINGTYSNLLAIYKKELPDLQNSFTLKQTCIEFTYDWFMRSCGIKNLAEKRFAQTIAAVMRFKDKIIRIRVFGRLLGIIDPLEKESFKFYLICLNYLMNVSTFGYIVPATDQDDVHYTPFIRVTDFMRTYFEQRISIEEYTDLKIQIEKLKEPDFKKNRNTQIVEMDKTIEILITKHLDILNQKRGHVQELLTAFDFTSMEIMDFQAFYLLMTHIQGDKYSYQHVKDMFERSSELIAIQSIKDTSKYLTLESFISLCFQEKIFNKDSQAVFLKISDSVHSQDEITEHVQNYKDQWDQIATKIKQRFCIQPYFKDLITVIGKLLGSATSGDYQSKKLKEIWILICVLEAQLQRQNQEIQASHFLGELNIFTEIGSGDKQHQELKALFEAPLFKRGKKILRNDFSITTVTSFKHHSGDNKSFSPIIPQKKKHRQGRKVVSPS